MPTQAATGVEAACAALAFGGCRGACSLFEAALEQEETPEALDGLAGARWSCGDSAEPSGRRVAVELAESYKIRDGRFVGYWCQADVAGLVRQLTAEQEPARVS
jgi:hypothetical protein